MNFNQFNSQPDFNFFDSQQQPFDEQFDQDYDDQQDEDSSNMPPPPPIQQQPPIFGFQPTQPIQQPQLGYYDLNHRVNGSAYKFPKCPPNFQNTCPPFPAPDPSYKFQAFKSFAEFKFQVSQTPDLNNSYIAFPIPFMTRWKDYPSQTFPLFGYFIHK